MRKTSTKFCFFAFLLCLSVALPVSAWAVSSRQPSQATFAGGCFWCMVPPFEKLNGVRKVISGYMGGHTKNPTYEQVSAGGTGHREVVQVIFDPAIVSYAKLLEVFWSNINPTDGKGQFVDKGQQYTSAIFYHNNLQKRLALFSEKKLKALHKFKKPIVTKILPAGPFYKAEEYHQDYYKKNPLRYKFYRYRSGRDQFLDKIWGKQRKVSFMEFAKDYKKPSDEELKKKLTKIQYQVTQHAGTEKPFKNEYWDNKKPGIYVDIVTGEPLFSSLDKFESGTGWPSFTKPLVPDNIITREDRKLFSVRTEVLSKHGNSHLGHVFTDGPAPTGLRYCMNSAALRFIPADQLDKEGYGDFKYLFQGPSSGNPSVSGPKDVSHSK